MLCMDSLAHLPSPRQVEEAMEPGPELLMPLLPYQKEFLAWAVKQEQSAVRGGVLADEMGMGKTIQVCAWRSCHCQASHRMRVYYTLNP